MGRLLSVLLILWMVAGAVAQEQHSLNAVLCPIGPDSTFPGFAIELRPIVDSAMEHCGVQPLVRSPDLYPRRQWYTGAPLHKSAAGDTLPNTDGFGRTFFERVRTEDKRPSLWQARTADGVQWALRVTARYSDRMTPDTVNFEIVRGDSVVFQGRAMDDFNEAFQTAWVRGDTCVVIYQTSVHHNTGHGTLVDSHYHAVRNGIPLDYDDIWYYTYLADRPFFFFERDGAWSWFYDGQEATEQFDQLMHNACCEPAM